MVAPPPAVGPAVGAGGPAERTDHYDDQMTRRMTATEAKATILAVLDDVALGEEVEITKHGIVVAKLVPAPSSRALRGIFTGVAMTAKAGDDLLSTDATWNLG